MANRVITSLGQIQATEFMIGANHPDALADTLNRGLNTAWSVLLPQIKDTIEIEYVGTVSGAEYIDVKAGGMCQLPSGSIVIIDTPVRVSVPLGVINDSLRYLWVGLSSGLVSFEFSTSNVTPPVSLLDAKLTRMSINYYVGSGQLTPFKVHGDWLYMFSNQTSDTASLTATPSTITLDYIGNTREALVYYSLTPTQTASVLFYAETPADNSADGSASPCRTTWIDVSGTTKRFGFATVPLNESLQFKATASAGTVSATFKVSGWKF